MINMNTQEIINLAHSKDNESMYFELKELNYDLDMNNYLKSIVAFANRSGGRLIIGIKEDGSAQGVGIFNKFEQGKHNGIDKFKECLKNKISTKISPSIEVEIKYHLSEQYEFIEILIPKRKGIPHAIIKDSSGKIKSREYYIRTSSSSEPITDTQLDWLFSRRVQEVEFKSFNIEKRHMKI